MAGIYDNCHQAAGCQQHCRFADGSQGCRRLGGYAAIAARQIAQVKHDGISGRRDDRSKQRMTGLAETDFLHQAGRGKSIPRLCKRRRLNVKRPNQSLRRRVTGKEQRILAIAGGCVDNRPSRTSIRSRRDTTSERE